ncbi:MFS transporter [Reyranella sp. CPCC 100927]|uniref:MFS transporter n=1 Tax=Reyranella sp. CPCC 100927 TaxID=2599616 RepID=UPI0011B461A7|nr:MFS transporter [Reyranella sp. CPCC 100927]TWT14060.1 MFS transporter [Reyranella sp. CPCC 100927]
MIPLRLASFGAAYFFVGGVGLSYWSVWLQSHGADPAEIGTLYMSRQFVTVAATLTIGWLAHRLVQQQRFLMLALVAVAIATLSTQEFAYGFWPLWFTTLVWGASWHPLLSLGEGVAVNVTRQRGLDYGRVRVWGSVTFIGGAVAAGLAVAHVGVPWVLYLSIIGAVLLVPCILWLPMPQRAPAASPGAAPRRVTARDLLRQPAFVLFLVAVGCTQAGHAVIYSFGTIGWRAAGIGDGTISFLWAEGILAEIVLFFFAGAVSARLGPVRLMILGAGGSVVRWALMPALGDSLPALLVLQALHALTFGATHLAAMTFLQRAVPGSAMTLAQSLYYGLANGLPVALVYQVAGVLYDRIGTQAYYAMALLTAVGLVAAIALSRRWAGSPLIDEPASS